jgi:ubiquinone/menaquinone biosynthesis C-methylase UbiE
MNLSSAFLRIRSALMRGFFHLLYHQLAWTYDGVASLVSLGMWQDWVTAALPYVRGPSVLELGPGPGHLQLALRRSGLNPIGLEASRQMSRLAYSRLVEKDKSSLIVNGYAQLMPFANASFHQVLATFPTEYIIDPDTIREISRVLAPGGECLVLPAAWITTQSFPFRWAARLFEITGQVPDVQPDWTGPFIQAGFSAETIPITLPHSRLIIIRACKKV